MLINISQFLIMNKIDIIMIEKLYNSCLNYKNKAPLVKISSFINRIKIYVPLKN
jgi:hypothetical protein